MREQTVEALRRFNEVIERLRAPDGCPWDRQQTHASLAPFLLEETYEALDTIAEGSPAALREELGDILLQVFLHSAIAAERRDGGDGFDLGDVAETVTAKMIHRHPHVFGDVTVGGADEVVVNWERLKATEKVGRQSLLDGVPTTLPALAYAEAVQRRPSRVGLDPGGDVTAVVGRLQQRLSELAVAEPDPSLGQDPASRGWTATDGGFAPPGQSVAGDRLGRADSDIERSIGELLFDVVTLARRIQVDPEAALRARARAFADRFRLIEREVIAEAGDVHSIDAEEWRTRWDAAAD